MTIAHAARLSDSPLVETVMWGQTLAEGAVIRPAEQHWHLVFSKRAGRVYPLVVGPWTTSGQIQYGEGAEILWIKFKLGTFMPHLPTRQLLDTEMALPEASSQTFWLKGSSWQFPTFENVDTFVSRLVRDEIIVNDSIVNATLQGQLAVAPSRTVRHRYLRATGLPQGYIRQIERAQQAMTLLQRGMSILDVVDQVGYADQPHLTRSLRQFIGYTPAQIAQQSS